MLDVGIEPERFDPTALKQRFAGSVKGDISNGLDPVKPVELFFKP